LTGLTTYNAAMTNDICWSICVNAGYAYFGTQYGTQCFCGNSYGSEGQAPESDCSMTCAGSPTQNCGGTNRNSIYKLINYQYVGCYVDNTPLGTRDLNGGTPTSTTSMTADYCSAYCAAGNYEYFGLQFGAQCFCGNGYGSQGQAPEGDCNMPCSGAPGSICGGSARNSVYRRIL